MHMTRKQLTAAFGALLLGIGVLGISSADAATHTSRAQCVTFTGTDRSQLSIHDGGTPGAGPGDSVVYHDEFTDTAGNHVGAADGTALVFVSPVDGSLREALNATGTALNGSVYVSGYVGVVEAQTQEQTLAAIGNGGALAGKVGTWKFKLAAQPAPNLTIFTVTMRLCG